MKAYLFPGQGSQYKGMGETLFSQFPEYIKQADEILGYSISDLCLNDPDARLAQTNYTQPAIFVVSSLQYLLDCHALQKPDYLLGHSVGEYAALFAAGSLDFATTLLLVKKRGELMSRAKGGGMAAIVGISLSELIEIIESSPFIGIEIANINAPDQIVIGAGKASLDAFGHYLEKINFSGRFIPLKVSGAFHTRLMRFAQLEFSQFLQSIKFSKPNIPVISNVTARVHTAEEIAENLVKHLASPVRWVESIEHCIHSDVNEFHEVGTHILLPMVNKIQVNYAENGPSQPYTLTEDSFINETNHAEDTNKASVPNLIASGKQPFAANKELVSALANQGFLSFLHTSHLAEDELSNTVSQLDEQGLNGKYGVHIHHDVDSNDLSNILNIVREKAINHIELQDYAVLKEEIETYKTALTEPENSVNGSSDVLFYLRSNDMDVIREALRRKDNRDFCLIDAITLEYEDKLFPDSNSVIETIQQIRAFCDEHTIAFQTGHLHIGISEQFPKVAAESFDFLVLDALLACSKEALLPETYKPTVRQALFQKNDSLDYPLQQCIDWQHPLLNKSMMALVINKPWFEESILLAELFQQDRISYKELTDLDTPSEMLPETFLKTCRGMSKHLFRAAVYKEVKNKLAKAMIPLTVKNNNLLSWDEEFSSWDAVSIAEFAKHQFHLNTISE